MNTDSTTGRSAPLGATVCAGGVNFCIYSRSAERMELLFFDDENDRHPARVIPINPIRGVQKWKQLLHRSWILNPFLGTPTNHPFADRGGLSEPRTHFVMHDSRADNLSVL